MNVFEILNYNSYLGQKLYTTVMGVCYLKKITEDDNIIVSNSDDPCNENCTILCFDKDGRFNKEGETLLFPSKEMRDWKSFAWKEGDILVNPVEDDSFVRFWKWNDDEYTTFKAKTLDGKCCDNIVCETTDFIEVNEEEKQKIESSCLKPGQKVLVRDAEDDMWTLHFFSHYSEGDKNRPVCLGGDYYVYTIPYKGNQHLLGTTKSK